MPDDEFDSTEELKKTAEQEYEERLKNIGGVNAAAAKMQAGIEERIDEIKDIGTQEGIEQVSKATSSVLRSLSAVIKEVAMGTRKITVGTALATKEAIGQYGKAISEDISFKKENIMAMGLARASPIFGYFASKFMETDVFKSAADRIKTTFSDAISSVGGKFKGLFTTGMDRVKGLFDKGKRAEAGAVPKLQAGGVVGKGGLAEVHKAEVVMPIDLLLKKIDELKAPSEKAVEAVGKPVKMFNRLLATMSKRQHSIEAYTLRRGPQERRGLIKSFLSAYTDTFEEYQLPWQQQMIRLQRRMVFGLIGIGNRFRIALSTMLYENPLIRNFLWSVGAIGKVFALPGTILFKKRGGYEADLPRSGKNPFENLVEIAGTTYTGVMYQSDKIIAHARASSEALQDIAGIITGKDYKQIEEIERQRWSIAGKSIRAIAAPIEWATKRSALLSEETKEFWTKKRGFTELLTAPFKKLFEKKEETKALPLTTMQKIEYIVDHLYGGLDKWAMWREKGIDIQQDQFEMIEDQRPWYKKMLGKTEAIKDASQKTSRRIRGFGRSALRWIMMAFGFVRSFIGNIGGIAAKFLSGSLFPMLGRLLPSLLRTIFSGPALAVALAGAGGLAVGSLVNKYIVEPFMERRSKRLQKQISEDWQKTEEGMRARKEASGGVGRGRVEAVHGARIASSLKGSMEDLRKRYYHGGIGSSEGYMAIQAAQQAYMEAHIGEYIPYGFDQVQMARIKFGEVAGKKMPFSDAAQYGTEREKRFLGFLKSQYKPVGLEALASTTKRRSLLDKAAVAGGVALEKARGVTTDRMALARGAAHDFILQTEPYVEMGKKTLKEMKEGTEQQTTAIISSTNTMVSSNQQNIATGGGGGQQQMGDHDAIADKVITDGT
jgi:hypothetical protein